MSTKENILNTALTLFARDGYEAVSVSDIAGAIGLTKSALYKHYKNKRDIFDSIVKRMYEYDYENAKKFDVPEDVFENMPDEYRKTEIEKISAYTFAQFLFWTTDSFASNFRKMLSIERWRNAEMEALYQQFLGTGPMAYTADLLREKLCGCSEAESRRAALEFYAPVYMLIDLSDAVTDKSALAGAVKAHIEDFVRKLHEGEYSKKVNEISYPKASRYQTPELMKLIMGPNPLKLEEELLENHLIPAGAKVCDLGSGTGLTSVFMAKEYGFKVYAADLWSDPEENRKFFASQGLSDEQILPVKADATALPFEKEFFDAVVSVDSYNYFGRDESYLGQKLLPFVKKGGLIYIAIPGMKKDCHNELPPELLLSWSPEQLDFMHDLDYWRNIISKAEGIEIMSLREMRSNKEVWDDWLAQENEYAIGDRKSMEAGGGKYLNFIEIILRKL